MDRPPIPLRIAGTAKSQDDRPLYPVGCGDLDLNLSCTGEGKAQKRRDPSTRAESEDPSPGSVTRLSWVTSAVMARRRSLKARAHHGADRHQAGLQIAPERHHQLAGERHDRDLADAALVVADPLA